MNRLIEHLQFQMNFNQEDIERLCLVDDDSFRDEGHIEYLGEENKFLKEMIDKLKALQSLEEELGISLPILFKAWKNGIYSRDYGWLLVEHFVLKMKEQLHCKPTYRKELRFALKDYKKTWALCKEDLKNE